MTDSIDILITTSFGGKDGKQALKEIHERKEIVKTKSASGKADGEVEILSGDLAREVLEELEMKYKDWKALDGIGFDSNSGPILGSNPYYVVAVNELLKEKGYRVASHAEVEFAFQMKKLPAEQAYHTGLIWRSNRRPNAWTAGSLEEEFASHNITLVNNTAYLLPLWTLKLEKNCQMKYNFSFSITDETLAYHRQIDILTKEGYFKNSGIDFGTGLPFAVYRQATPELRYLSTTKEGVSVLCLDVNGDVTASTRKLAKTLPEGRTAIVKYDREAKV